MHYSWNSLIGMILISSLVEADETHWNVRVEICEQRLADQDVWPETPPTATDEFVLPALALDELPVKYVDDGVRGARPSPSLLRMSATIDVPAGQHRLLLRSRSAARLTVNGLLLVETPFPPKNGGDGSQPDSERLAPLDLGVGFRFAPGGEYERITDWEAPGGPVSFILEAFIGGREGKSPRRVELGETVAGISLGGSQSWNLLAPNGVSILYTDEDWAVYRGNVASMLADRNARSRKTLRANHDPYWVQRREIAAQWLRNTPDEPVPRLPEGFAAANPVDHFIAAKFVNIRTQYAGSDPAPSNDRVDYFRDVNPLLDNHCRECHRGSKAKGHLRIDTRVALLKGGDSGPAAVPGDSANSELLRRISSHDNDTVMPPNGMRLTEEKIGILKRWIEQGIVWPELPLLRPEFTEICDDSVFVRRVMLDTVGVPPTSDEASRWIQDASPDKRAVLIDRLLEDPRWADQWMPLWQDLLAENPNILNPTLNNTGPFRWWLYDSLQDDIPVDRMMTQLIQQRGDSAAGGPEGFGLASQNDAPFAAKGTIISAALLGVDMKCARCYDSPTGSARQEQLFQLGAMLAMDQLEVPVTSSVDPAKLNAGGRKALIEVTLVPGSKVAPDWPFPDLIDTSLAKSDSNSRDRLAFLITSPQNERFAQVIVNRIWGRLMGRGIVEPLDDWEKGHPTHPELLRWLGRELVRSGYQTKSVVRLILNSYAYQRATDVNLHRPDPLYSAPEPRRLLAEQVVDTLFSTTGKPLRLEPLCLDLNGRRDVKNAVHLGTPRRAWMLASLSNERDRPSLTLPRLQAVHDVLAAMGWRGARQDPSSTRETLPNVQQPAILANGVVSGWLTRLSDDHPLTRLAMEATSPKSLVEELFMRLLTRAPTAEERERYVEYLAPDFPSRLIDPASIKPPSKRHAAPRFVTWTNHLLPESNTAKQELELEAHQGDPPTMRLEPVWRQRCEDVIWALINSPEMLYRP